MLSGCGGESKPTAASTTTAPSTVESSTVTEDGYRAGLSSWSAAVLQAALASDGLFSDPGTLDQLVAGDSALTSRLTDSLGPLLDLHEDRARPRRRTREPPAGTKQLLSPPVRTCPQAPRSSRRDSRRLATASETD